MDGQVHGEWSGFGGDRNKGTVITTMELNKYFNGENRSYLSEFEEYIESQPNPKFSTDFSNKNLISHIEGNKQITDKTKIDGTDKISLTFELQEGVTIVCDNKGWTGSGKVTVTNGDIIHFEAPLNVTGKWTSKQIENGIIFQSLIMSTSEEGYQRLAQGGEFVTDSRKYNFFFNSMEQLGKYRNTQN